MKSYNKLTYIKGKEREVQNISESGVLFYAEDTDKTFLLDGTNIEEIGTASGGGETPTLQEVTDEGATTTNAVQLGNNSQIGSGGYAYLKLGGDNSHIEYDDGLFIRTSSQGDKYTSLMIDYPTDNNNHHIYTPRDKSGTLALIEDLQSFTDDKVNSKVEDEPTGSDKVVNMVSLTQAEYNAGTPKSDTFYIITDA